MTTDAFHAHEALDRADMIARIWHEFVQTHAFVTANPDLKHAADEIGDLLGMFYQQVGDRLS